MYKHFRRDLLGIKRWEIFAIGQRLAADMEEEEARDFAWSGKRHEQGEKQKRQGKSGGSHCHDAGCKP